MTPRKLFVVSVGVGAGGVLCIALLVGAWAIWEGRAPSRSSSTVVAKVRETVLWFPSASGPPVLETEVALTNNSARDLSINASSIRAFLRTQDGVMREAQRADEFPKELFLPAGDSTVYKVPLVLSSTALDRCSTPATTDNQSPEFQKFLENCVKHFVAAVLLVDAPSSLSVNIPLFNTVGGNDKASLKAVPKQQQSTFDPTSAAAVPTASAKFDCSKGQVVRYDRNGRAVCLLPPFKGQPWDDDPLANRGDACDGKMAKVYDESRNEYCVDLARIDHFGAH